MSEKPTTREVTVFEEKSARAAGLKFITGGYKKCLSVYRSMLFFSLPSAERQRVKVSGVKDQKLKPGVLMS